MSNLPLISIIIAVKNAADGLQQTLASLRQQDYPKLEIVVIDGNSNDGSVAIIQNNLDIISSWISEVDRGISDAFNKESQVLSFEPSSINMNSWLMLFLESIS